MNGFKKILPKLLLFLLISIVVIIIVFSLGDLKEIGKVLTNVKYPWLFCSIGLLVLYIIFNPMSLVFLGKSKEEGNIKASNSLIIGTMEYFFNGITPFSSGGQPFQIYAYRKLGVSYHRSSGIILLNFVVNQLSIVILCLVSLFFYDELTRGQVGLQVMIIIGITMNLFILSLFASVGLSKTLRNLLFKFVNWLVKRKIFKGKLNKFVDRFENYCEGAQKTFKVLLKQKRKFFLCLITKLFALICFYAIPFFILKALGIEVEAKQFALITAMTTFAIAMTCYIPTPGATGGIEFAFKTLFITILPAISDSVAYSGMLLWRMLTYYLLMLVSFIVYLIFEKRQSMQNIEVDDVLEEVSISCDQPLEEKK